MATRMRRSATLALATPSLAHRVLWCSGVRSPVISRSASIMVVVDVSMVAIRPRKEDLATTQQSALPSMRPIRTCTSAEQEEMVPCSDSSISDFHRKRWRSSQRMPDKICELSKPYLIFSASPRAMIIGHDRGSASGFVSTESRRTIASA